MSEQDFISLVESGDVESVEDFLNSHQITLNQTLRDLSALNKAVDSGNIEMVKLLLKYGAGFDNG